MNIAIALILGSLLAFFPSGGQMARSQPSNPTWVIPMCPVVPIQIDAQGNTVYASCGTTPQSVTVTPQLSAPGPVASCKANPLTGKAPPLC